MMHRILVVEDHVVNRELLCDWLEAHGYEVFGAEDLNAARQLLQREQLDAVLLDVQLGKEDGLSLASWMRKRTNFSGMPVIAVTAHAMATEQQSFLRAGCNACISKPIDFASLNRELKKWLVQVGNSSARG